MLCKTRGSISQKVGGTAILKKRKKCYQMLNLLNYVVNNIKITFEYFGHDIQKRYVI